MAEELKAIKERARAIGLTHRVWARLASTPESRIHEPNLSNWLCGVVTSQGKVKRLLTTLESVEKLCAADPLKLDLSDAENVRFALARLAEKKAASNAAQILAADEKKLWARGVAVAPTNSELLSDAGVTQAE